MRSACLKFVLKQLGDEIGPSSFEKFLETLSSTLCGCFTTGNQYLLQTHDKWKELIDVYRGHGAVVDARSFLRKW